MRLRFFAIHLIMLYVCHDVIYTAVRVITGPM